MKAYQIKIELLDITPTVWRRFVVPADINFKRFHDTIQIVMGWNNEHLYDFNFDNGQILVTADNLALEEWKFYYSKYKKEKLLSQEADFNFIENILSFTLRKSSSTRLEKYFDSMDECRYTYDFSSYWVHKIVLEKVIKDYEFVYPQVLAGAGSCPIENIGGMDNYKEFFDVFSNPLDENHVNAQEWAWQVGYASFDKRAINEFMKKKLKLKRIKK